ncbi:MAG: DUF5362 family protein [Gelidibacter sp.]
MVIGLMFLAGVIFSVTMGGILGDNSYNDFGIDMSYFGIIYIVMGLIYFFPVLYLFNFSRKMKSALSLNTNEDLTAAFSNLKSHYKFLGVFTIVIISLYVLIVVIAMISATL